MSFLLSGIDGIDYLESVDSLTTRNILKKTRTGGEIDVSFIWDFISDSFQLLTVADRQLIEELWKGIFQSCSSLLLEIYQADFAKELMRVPIEHQAKWVKYDFQKTVNTVDLSEEDIYFTGRGESVITYNSVFRYIKATAVERKTLDKMHIPLRGHFNPALADASFNFTFSVQEFPGNSSIVFVGYYDSENSKSLNNSILVGIGGDGSLLVCSVDEEGQLRTRRWEDVFTTPRASYSVSTRYTNGRFEVQVYLNGAKRLSKSVLLGGTISVDSIGISNNIFSSLNPAIDSVLDIVGGEEFSIFINFIGYTDPSAGDEIIEIPYLQNQPQNLKGVNDPSTFKVYRQNIDYVITDGTLVFNFASDDRSLWAEFVLYKAGAVWDNFGRLVELMGEDSEEYRSAVQGMWFVYMNGPAVFNMEIGLNILLGMPFAVESGYITKVEPLYDEDEGVGRIIVDNRKYLYDPKFGIRKDTDGNELTEGSHVEKFLPLVEDAAKILDYKNDPDWFFQQSLNELSLPFPNNFDKYTYAINLLHRNLEPLTEEIFHCSSLANVIDYGDDWLEYEVISGDDPTPASSLTELFDAEGFESYTDGLLGTAAAPIPSQDGWLLYGGENLSAILGPTFNPFQLAIPEGAKALSPAWNHESSKYQFYDGTKAWNDDDYAGGDYKIVFTSGANDTEERIVLTNSRGIIYIDENQVDGGFPNKIEDGDTYDLVQISTLTVIDSGTVTNLGPMILYRPLAARQSTRDEVEVEFIINFKNFLTNIPDLRIDGDEILNTIRFGLLIDIDPLTQYKEAISPEATIRTFGTSEGDYEGKIAWAEGVESVISINTDYRIRLVCRTANHPTSPVGGRANFDVWMAPVKNDLQLLYEYLPAVNTLPVIGDTSNATDFGYVFFSTDITPGGQALTALIDSVRVDEIVYPRIQMNTSNFVHYDDADIEAQYGWFTDPSILGGAGEVVSDIPSTVIEGDVNYIINDINSFIRMSNGSGEFLRSEWGAYPAATGYSTKKWVVFDTKFKSTQWGSVTKPIFRLMRGSTRIGSLYMLTTNSLIVKNGNGVTCLQVSGTVMNGLLHEDGSWETISLILDGENGNHKWYVNGIDGDAYVALHGYGPSHVTKTTFIYDGAALNTPTSLQMGADVWAVDIDYIRIYAGDTEAEALSTLYAGYEFLSLAESIDSPARDLYEAVGTGIHEIIPISSRATSVYDKVLKQTGLKDQFAAISLEVDKDRALKYSIDFNFYIDSADGHFDLVEDIAITGGDPDEFLTFIRVAYEGDPSPVTYIIWDYADPLEPQLRTDIHPDRWYHVRLDITQDSAYSYPVIRVFLGEGYDSEVEPVGIIVSPFKLKNNTFDSSLIGFKYAPFNIDEGPMSETYVEDWDADTNTPDLATISSGLDYGMYYIISVAGSTSLEDEYGGSIDTWGVNDLAIVAGVEEISPGVYSYKWRKIINDDEKTRPSFYVRRLFSEEFQNTSAINAIDSTVDTVLVVNGAGIGEKFDIRKMSVADSIVWSEEDLSFTPGIEQPAAVLVDETVYADSTRSEIKIDHNVTGLIPGYYIGMTLEYTGVVGNDGVSRTIQNNSQTSIFLSEPFDEVPVPGDLFTIYEPSSRTVIAFGRLLTPRRHYYIDPVDGKYYLNYIPEVGHFSVARYRHLPAGMHEVQKFNTFNVRLGNLLLDWQVFIDNLVPFVSNVRPNYARTIYTDLDGLPILRYDISTSVLDVGTLLIDQYPYPVPYDYGD